MAFKNLEHEGNETFEVSTRREIAKSDVKRSKAVEKLKDQTQARAQEIWLSPENPLIWTPIID